jgi:hypothetical protein
VGFFCYHLEWSAISPCRAEKNVIHSLGRWLRVIDLSTMCDCVPFLVQRLGPGRRVSIKATFSLVDRIMNSNMHPPKKSGNCSGTE